MARLSPSPSVHSSNSGSSSYKRLAIGFVVSVSTIITTCAKKATRVSKKFLTAPSNSKTSPTRSLSPSPPSKLLSSIMSSKAILYFQKKKAIGRRRKKSSTTAEYGSEEEFGDGGVWQRSIMMGDKCQPLNFSGVIYYDNCGNQVSDLPLRSPRASPLPSYAFKNGNDGVRG